MVEGCGGWRKAAEGGGRLWKAHLHELGEGVEEVARERRRRAQAEAACTHDELCDVTLRHVHRHLDADGEIAPEAIRRSRKRSEAIRSDQRRSEAIRSDQRQSEAIRGDQPRCGMLLITTLTQ